MTKILIFVLGLITGSFLNVCIYRLPRKESVITPRSHCTYCGKTIAWYDNIPLLSYVLLGGRCRFCKTKISALYFVVELLTGIIFLTNLIRFGFRVPFIVYTILACALIVIAFIDLKTEEIPDELTLPGMAAGLVLSFIFPQLMQQGSRILALRNSFLGLLAGGLSIYLIAVFGKILFRKKLEKLKEEEAMGGGDIKLLAMIGAFLGWKLVLLVFFLAPFLGSIVGIILRIKDKREIIPYGPYLSLATVIVILWGNKILNWIL